MGVTAEIEYFPEHILGASAAAFGSMVSILDVLGNQDALAIFIYVENGISSSKIAIQELELTQKRFYSRLKELINVGLIEKNEGLYQYTTLGRIFSKIGYSLLNILENKDQFELLEKLRENSSLSTNDFKKITSVVSKGSNNLSGIVDMLFLSEDQNVEVLFSYERLVEKLVDVVEGSKETVCLASKYLDNKVIDSMIKASTNGIPIRVIMAKEHLEEKISKLKLLLSPGAILSMLEFFSDPNSDEIMRDGNTPFSFAIIDAEHCFFELPSTENNDFMIAFYVDDNEIGNKFCKMFSNLWDTADTKSISNIFQMLKSG